MLAARASRRSGRAICNRCSLRLHIVSLQQRRLRSTARDESSSSSASTLDDVFASLKSDENSGPVRYYAQEGDGSAVPKSRHSRVEGSSFIRKTSVHAPREGGVLQMWGLDETSKNRRQDARFREALMDSLKKVQEEVKDAPVLKQLTKDESFTREKLAESLDVKDGGTGVVRLSNKKPGLDFDRMWQKFADNILKGGQERKRDERKVKRIKNVEASPKGSELWHDLRQAYSIRGASGLEDRIKFAFYGHVTGSRFTASDVRHQKILADLRYPSEWFPATREMQRQVHLHVGPTNSGKTYHALKRLEQADSGAYAGPLRLLAHEVYTRLNAKGKACALLTGEERRAMTDAPEDKEGIMPTLATYDMMACTVEMVPVNKTMDVCVIDEIQMIGSKDRGWAWTQALLGVKAREVHLCGEERTVPLIKELCASVGDKLTIHHYERLSPLMVADKALNGDLKKLRKGDCIVSFSVMGIHALRKEIERQTGRKVATVYGSLPPETRAQQARLFNDPDNDYDFLVASDAVGMGLNLAIKRVIFEAANKFDGISRKTLTVAEIKQIGGRAGRFRIASQADQKDASEQELAAAKGENTPPVEVLKEVIPATTESSSPPPQISHHPLRAQKSSAEIYKMPPDGTVPDGIGIITTLERFDYQIVRAAMASEPEPITTAGLFPPSSVLERFSSYFPPGTPFSYILTRLHELSQMHSRFHLCGLKEQVWIADLIEPVSGLTIADRNIIVSSPASKADTDLWKDLMPEYARAIADQKGGAFLDIKSLPLELLDEEISVKRTYLRGLERLHKGIVSFLWLSYRFHGIFKQRGLANYVKGLVEERIEKVLKLWSFTEEARRKAVKDRERAFLDGLERFGEGETEAEADGGKQVTEKPVAEQDGEVEGQDKFALERGEVESGAQVSEGGIPGDELDVDGVVVPDQQDGVVGGLGQFGGEAEDVIFEEDDRLDAAKPESAEKVDPEVETTSEKAAEGEFDAEANRPAAEETAENELAAEAQKLESEKSAEKEVDAESEAPASSEKTAR